jgi:exosome complex RNA-binding protein Rrp42 (RNase PH superfamily)
MIVKHPEVTVHLLGEDGNAFSIIGNVTAALRRAKVPENEIEEYMAEAMSGDYNEVLQTTMRWVDVD